MTKSFQEALSDGFKHIDSITNPEQLTKLREEGILVDTDGYYTFIFGENKEYEVCIEPIGTGYYLSIYKNRIRLTEPLPIQPMESGT